jgi:hypothetical protein
MSDSELKLTYDYLLNQLNYLGQSYLHIAGALENDIRHDAYVLELSVFREPYTDNLSARAVMANSASHRGLRKTWRYR